MPVEFRCIHCQKLLRVSDEAIGKKARCPDCGTIQEARPNAGMESAPSAPVVGPAPAAPAVTPANPFGERAGTASPFSQSAANPYVSPQPLGQRTSTIEMSRLKVQAPAMGILILGGIMSALGLIAVVMMIFVAVIAGPRMDDIVPNLISSFVMLAIGITMVVGGQKMRRLESYSLAITGAVLAIVPCTICCPLSVPLGIWSLVVLLDPQVRTAFETQAL
jgi:phage FluMu protein Com